MAGKYKIPMEAYYSKSKSIHSKVNKTKTDANKLLKLISSSGLSEQDMAAIKSSEGYRKGKKAVQKFETKYLKELSQMSSEGGSNPMNPIVETDKQYAAKFKAAEKANAPGVSSAIHAIDVQVNEKVVKDTILDLAKDFTNNNNYDRIKQFLKEGRLGEAVTVLFKDKKMGKFLSGEVEDKAGAERILAVICNGLKKVSNFPKAGLETLGNSTLFRDCLKDAPNGIRSKILGFLGKLNNGEFKLMDKGGTLLNIIGDIADGSLGKKIFDNITRKSASKIAGKFAKSELGKCLNGHLSSFKNSLGKMLTSGVDKFGSSNLGKAISGTWNVFSKTKLGRFAGSAALVEGGKLVSSTIDDFKSTHDLGKALVGGAIDTVKDVGPLNGALIGAEFGPVGALIGGGVGAINKGIQYVNPHLYQNIKKETYKTVGKTEQAIGKAEKEVNKAAKNIYKKFKEREKKVKTAASWFKLA